MTATFAGVVGEPYRDASGNECLPMFVQPVLVYEADGAALRRAYERAMSRGVTPAVYTHELFATNHDQANRAAVAALAAEDLDLDGIAFRAERKAFGRSSTGCACIPDLGPEVTEPIVRSRRITAGPE